MNTTPETEDCQPLYLILQRQNFEAAAYAHYLQRHADGKTADRRDPPAQPHQLFWRQPDGEYGVLMFNASWWGWKAGQGL